MKLITKKKEQEQEERDLLFAKSLQHSLEAVMDLHNRLTELEKRIERLEHYGAVCECVEILAHED